MNITNLLTNLYLIAFIVAAAYGLKCFFSRNPSRLADRIINNRLEHEERQQINDTALARFVGLYSILMSFAFLIFGFVFGQQHAWIIVFVGNLACHAYLRAHVVNGGHFRKKLKAHNDV
jgi:uncharacterized membrane protein SpoIIM required for sporulation